MQPARSGFALWAARIRILGDASVGLVFEILVTRLRRPAVDVPGTLPDDVILGVDVLLAARHFAAGAYGEGLADDAFGWGGIREMDGYGVPVGWGYLEITHGLWAYWLAIGMPEIS